MTYIDDHRKEIDKYKKEFTPIKNQIDEAEIDRIFEDVDDMRFAIKIKI